MPASYNELMRNGVGAAKAGQRNDAYKYFSEAIRLNPRDTRAWLYLAYVSPTRETKQKALETVLQLEPSNERAQELLQNLRDSESTVQSLQTQMHTATQPDTVSRSGKRRKVYMALLISVVIIVGIIVVVILLKQSDDLADQKQFLVRICLLENEDTPHSECEEAAEEAVEYFSTEINPCYAKYSDNIDLFKRCLEEPLERRINQSGALNTYCVYVLYPSCREQVCDSVPEAVRTQCATWSDDIVLNHRDDVDKCWTAFTPPEYDWYTWYGGKVASDEIDPFGKCIEERIKPLLSIN